MTLIQLISLLLFVIVIRNFLVFCMTITANFNFAKKRMIEKSPIKADQIRRERFMMLKGTVVDTLAAFIFFKLGVLKFHAGHPWIECIIILSAHFLVVEPVYYFYHLLLHKHWFYKHHHVHHHLSRVTNPNTSFTFTLSERITYTLLFAIPLVVASMLGVLSMGGFVLYIIIFDMVNALGHLNFEVFPSWYQKSFLRYIFYTPTFHSKHHTKFLCNYTLFSPIWDYAFKTISMEKNESPD